MHENEKFNEIIDLDEEIDLRDIFSVLWRGKYFVFVFTAIFLVAGSIYLRSLTPEYQVSILLAPVQA